MRIVHVYNWLDPANGGTPRVVVGLCAEQQRLGHEIRLVSSDKAGAPAVEAFLGERLDAPPRRWVVRPKFFTPLLTRPALSAALEGADVAHLHGLWPPASMLAAQVCRARGIPYVFTAHGGLHQASLARKPLRKWIGRRLLGWGRCVARADALHLLNEAEVSAARWRLPARLEVIPNGIPAEEFAELPTHARFRATVPGLGEAPYLLSLSRLHHSKGCDRLIRAFACVAAMAPDAQLVLAGPDEGAGASLRRLTAARGLEGRIRFVGMLRGDLKRAALAGATACCFPSRHEGFSVAILEAMACGRPVIISEECHFPEVARRGCGWVVARADDPPELAAPLLEALDDPQAAAEMGRRGRAFVLDELTWARVAERMVGLYASVIEGAA